MISTWWFTGNFLEKAVRVKAPCEILVSQKENSVS